MQGTGSACRRPTNLCRVLNRPDDMAALASTAEGTDYTADQQQSFKGPSKCLVSLAAAGLQSNSSFFVHLSTAAYRLPVLP
jgi:hypothetical protein